MSLALCACGMRSVLSEDVDGPTPQAVVEPDAGTGAAGNSSAGGTHPCGRAGATGCDPTDLDGHSCQSLGAGSGTLACDPSTCTFDLSMCTIGTQVGGSAGAPGGSAGGGMAGAGSLFGGGNAGTGGGLFGGGSAGSGGRGGRGGRGGGNNPPQ